MRRGVRRNWTDIDHPRGNTHWADMPAEHQEAAIGAIQSLGAGGENAQAVHAAVTGDLEKLTKKMAGMKSIPGKLQQQHEVLTRGAEHLADIGPTGMDESVKSIRNAAMLPIKAARAVTRRGGPAEAPLAGEYYTARHNVGRIIGEHTFGKGSEGAERTMLASPTLSARTPPQKEVMGGAGLAATMRDAEEIGVSLGPTAISYINERLRGTSNYNPLEEGTHSLAHVAREHPQAAALLLQHGAAQAGLVVPKPQKEEKLSASKIDRDQSLAVDARLHIPRGSEGPVAALVSSAGNVGFPKIGRAIQRFNADPNDFGESDFHKINSYGWNIHAARHPEIQHGVYHTLGAITHGDRWFAEHPDAEHHIRKAMAHPAWHDPTSTQDVWAARLGSGLPVHVAQALGERTNPEHIMAFGGLGGIRRTQRGLGNAADLGYLYDEEAHRKAAWSLSAQLPGGGRVHMPAPVVQSLSWFGVQALADPESVRSGEKTLTPSSSNDPRSLNPLHLPSMW